MHTIYRTNPIPAQSVAMRKVDDGAFAIIIIMVAVVVGVVILLAVGVGLGRRFASRY